MILDKIGAFTFMSRSGGVVVLRGDHYLGFFDTLEDAIQQTLEN